MRLAAPEEVPKPFRAAILQALPEFSGLSISVAGRGWHSLALDIAGRFIAKFPEGAEAEEALRREARLLAVVRPHLTMPVPNMTIVESPRLFSIHPKLAGDVIEQQDYARLAVPARERLASDLALFLAELHHIDPSELRSAGAGRVELWETADAALEPVWPRLDAASVAHARLALEQYRALGPDPIGEAYGFFDAHGWNMAFSAEDARLNGIFDFADSGFGPAHREFVPISLIDPDLALRVMRGYGAQTGCPVDVERVYLLTCAMRLSELAGAIGTGAENTDEILRSLVEWLDGREAFLAG